VPQYIAFVDAGYLIAEGARALGLPRQDTQPNAQGCVEWLTDLAGRDGCPLLRAYWYDGAFDSGSPRYQSQRPYLDAIASTPGIQLRLGHIGERTPAWQYSVRQAVLACGVELAEFERHFQFRPELTQKGVDTLMALDIVRLAQRRAYDTAVIIAGDRDLAEAIRVAQDEGRRMVLAPPEAGGVATELRQLADVIIPIEGTVLPRMLRNRRPSKIG
jgi:uncharacterized LabA/DUF88 family protein